jgi:predicted RNase H-like HicB family nuclease
MDMYEVQLEPAEPDGFAATVPALPGLLVLGRSVDEVLDRARAAIAFRVGMRQITVMPRQRAGPYAA